MQTFHAAPAPAFARDRGVAASRAGIGNRRGIRETPDPQAVRRTPEYAEGARRHGYRVGPAATRTEHLGDPWPHRGHGERQARHGDTRTQRSHGVEAVSARKPTMYRGRRITVLSIVAVAVGGLLWRAVDLQLLHKDFLQGQGDARHLRVVSIPAHRGMITDRNGEPLAISTPVDTNWANPRDLLEARGFPGVATQREYRRYYPAGEVTGHLLGFTNVDDEGQEGVELSFEQQLRGTPGSMRVVRDRLGRIVETVERLSEPVPGRDVALSIDRRMQYLAYRELKAAVQANHAKAGSAVVLDAHTGEVLAMVNQPAFNPNNRENLRSERYRNRAMTDVYEPGSTVKPFTLAVALESGQYQPTTPIDTRPGTLRVGPNTIRDVHDYGLIDVSTVIVKSSNVGTGKIALSLPPERLWHQFTAMGLGSPTGIQLPGEASGSVPDYHRWYPIDRVTFSFGYGLSTSILQMARAYAALASGGVLKPVSLLPVTQPPEGQRVMNANTAHQLVAMLEGAVGDKGTGRAARVSGYRVAGKTGTVRRSGVGGYEEDSYLSLFAGMVPASDPRLVMVVMINDPRGDEYYGGLVAAPVFGRVMGGALRLLDIAPDDLQAPTIPAAAILPAARKSGVL